MESKIKAWSLSVGAGLLLEGWVMYMVGPTSDQWRPALIVKDEPAAHALYDTMLQTIRQARSLSYQSGCHTSDEGSGYRVWLQKPASFRVEQNNSGSQQCTTVLDDGCCLWVHWSGSRPTVVLDTVQSREAPRSNAYVKRATLAGTGSIRTEVALHGTAFVRPVFDPSLFFGNLNPLAKGLDGIRSRGTDWVQDEECDVIEVGFLHARQTQYLWLSRQDHLPRRLKEVVRGAQDRVTVEEWSDVQLDAEVPAKVLAWSPPADGQPWDPPTLADSLVPRGQPLPDFQFCAARRGKIRLSDYRGQVVWLYVWDAGSPQCREEIARFQQWYPQYQDKGLALLGFNCDDNPRIARAFLRETGVTLTTVLDPSEAAAKLLRREFGNKLGLVPLNYILDPQGRVVDAWFGTEQNSERALAALKAAGLGLAQ